MPELSPLAQAAHAIKNAQQYLFTAGAGMGVDSNLPDFRGDEGFWRAYPPMKKLGLSFAQMANPLWFERDPELAWGFYGHRLNLYRATTPHQGFSILNKWGSSKNAHIFTSNVDGHFQKSGFSEVCEVHGSIFHLQCTKPCSSTIWDANELQIEVEAETFRAKGQKPLCPRCGALARPNIFMFGDSRWRSDRSDHQLEKLESWLKSLVLEQLVIIECGAGKAIPTVRHLGDRLHKRGAKLVRINPRESDVPYEAISLEMGALAGLRAIDARMFSI